MGFLKGLIKCGECGKNYNFKNNTNNNYVYICSQRKNYGANKCNAPIIKESFLLDLIETHLRHLDKEYSPTKIKLFVSEIRISNDLIKILYKDGTYSEVDSTDTLTIKF